MCSADRDVRVVEIACERCTNVFPYTISRGHRLRLCPSCMRLRKLTQVRDCHKRVVARGLCRTCHKPRGEDGTENECRPCRVRAEQRCTSAKAQRRRETLRLLPCEWCGGSMEHAPKRARRYCSVVCREFGKRRATVTLYRRRQEAGLCARCGRLRGKRGTRWNCNPCAAVLNLMLRARAKRLRAARLCTACAKRNARPERDRCVRCEGLVTAEGAA